MSFRVLVDLTNPGQFFACCGLLELAARMTGAAVGQFDGTGFLVDTDCSLTAVVDRLTTARLIQLDEGDDTASPIQIAAPFNLRLDWWKDDMSGGRDLKVWAGTMQSVRIARAMLAALKDPRFHTETLFDVGVVVYDEADSSKKVEPYYFDARRAPNAHSRDVGFSANDLELTTTAFPAVELLCLVGLQRFRPSVAPEGRRVFEYRAWRAALAAPVAATVVAGAVSSVPSSTYRFENWFRTGQKKHKAFRPATHVQGER
jgi:CRISPR-associated protein Csb3